jgi:hypothetical protein
MSLDWKNTSRVTFGAVLLCAFLPFVSVTCQGQRLATLTGVQLVSGTTLQEPTALGSNSEKVHRVQPEPLLIAVYVCALLGLLISSTSGNGAPRAGVLLASLGALGMLIVRARIENQAGQAGFSLTGLSIDYEIGFWLPLLLLSLTAVLGFRAVKRSRSAP